MEKFDFKKFLQKFVVICISMFITYNAIKLGIIPISSWTPRAIYISLGIFLYIVLLILIKVKLKNILLLFMKKIRFVNNDITLLNSISLILFGFILVLSLSILNNKGIKIENNLKGIYNFATNKNAKIIEDRQEARVLQNTSQIVGKVVGDSKDISSYYRKLFNITTYRLPNTIEYFDYGNKPSGFLFEVGEEKYLAQGDGSILRFELDSSAKVLNFTSVPSNLDSLLPKEVYEKSGFSIKGAIGFSDKIYLSTSWKSKDSTGGDCWKTSIIRADWQKKMPLYFKLFFEPKDCSTNYEFNPVQVGGALGIIPKFVLGNNEPQLIFAHGDYRSRKKAQEIESEFGSLMIIDTLKPQKNKIIAKGLRNPQDLKLTSTGIYLTEQGPQGGDELNFVSYEKLKSSVVNFGWPIASGGILYNSALRPNAPHYDDHERFGFTAPIFEWTPSVAVSTLIISETGKDNIVVGSMGDNSIEGDLSLHFLSPSQYSNELYNLDDLLILDLRVRDIERIGEDRIIGISDSGDIFEVTEIR
jgi:hypothetical protein